MKLQTLRAVAAVAGALGVAGIGLVGMSAGQSADPMPTTVLAPATDDLTVAEYADELTTTSSAPSFRPAVTATVPPPPTD